MSLPLHPEILQAAYDYFRTTRPFRQWNLPEGEDVKFKLIKDPANVGFYNTINGNHVIAVNPKYVGRTQSLMELMAHEMIHMHQRLTKTETGNTEHNNAFVKLAERVCKYHGFDPKQFV